MSKELKNILSLITIVWLALVIMFEVPWLYAVWQTQVELEKNPEIRENLMLYADHGEAWENTAAYANFASPVAALTGELKSSQVWDPSLRAIEPIDGTVVIVLEAIDLVASESVALSEEINALSQIDALAEATNMFLRTPNKTRLQYLASGYQLWEPHLTDTNQRMIGLLPSLREISEYADSLADFVGRLESIKATLEKVPLIGQWIGETIASFIDMFERAAASMDEMEESVEQFNEKSTQDVEAMQRVLALASGPQQREARFDNTPLELLFATSGHWIWTAILGILIVLNLAIRPK